MLQLVGPVHEFQAGRIQGGAGRMTNHNRRFHTLGILWTAYGILMLAAGLWIVLYNRTLTLMWGAIVSRVPDPFTWMDAFHFFLVLAVIMSVISAIFSLLAAAALLGGTASARKLGLIAALFAMLGTPLGIALGVFTVAILLPLPPSATPS
jgi:Na+/H+-dicarboxylate symporter